MKLSERARQAAEQGGAPASQFLIDLATSIEAIKEDIEDMRPEPPAPDTPNDGRTKRYLTLVEPDAQRKRDRVVVAAIAAAGFTVAVLADVTLRLVW